jgi:hypothetical protein
MDDRNLFYIVPWVKILCFPYSLWLKRSMDKMLLMWVMKVALLLIFRSLRASFVFCDLSVIA